MDYEDDDEQKEAILQMLGGEVDDFAGSQLKNPDEKNASQGVTIEISVKPHGGESDELKKKFAEEEAAEPEHANMAAGNEEHDPIAHILGMCGGGCAGK